MIIIGDKQLEKTGNLLNDLTILNEFLKVNSLILVNEEKIPLTEEEIKAQLSINKISVFNAKGIQEIENDLLKELIHYIDKIIYTIDKLSEEVDTSVIYSQFTDILESIIELESYTNYFKVTRYSKLAIEKLIEKGHLRMEEGNDTYLLELLEYELLPILEDIKEELRERE